MTQTSAAGGRGILPPRGRALVRFPLLLVPALLTVVAVVLFERLVDAIGFELDQGGMVSCNVGMGGVMVSCETSAAIRYAIGAVIAAAITACASRALDAPRPGAGGGAPERGRARDELLIAAIGPFSLLHIVWGTVLGYFGTFWGGVRMWTPGFLFDLLSPYAVASLLGTLGFWAVLRATRVRRGEGPRDPSRNAQPGPVAFAPVFAPAPTFAAAPAPAPAPEGPAS